MDHALNQSSSPGNSGPRAAVLSAEALWSALLYTSADAELARALVLDALCYHGVDASAGPIDLIGPMLADRSSFLSPEKMEGVVSALEELAIQRPLPSSVYDALLRLVGQNIFDSGWSGANWIVKALQLVGTQFSCARLTDLVRLTIAPRSIAAEYVDAYLACVRGVIAAGRRNAPWFSRYAEQELKTLAGHAHFVAQRGEEAVSVYQSVIEALREPRIPHSDPSAELIRRMAERQTKCFFVGVSVFAFAAFALAIYLTVRQGWERWEPVLFYLVLFAQVAGLVWAWVVGRRPRVREWRRQFAAWRSNRIKAAYSPAKVGGTVEN